MAESFDLRAGEESRARLDQFFNLILGLIGLQFFLGMWLNLFGNFPSGSGGLTNAFTFTADPILIAHVTLAVILTSGGILVLAMSWSDRLRTLRWYALGGFFGLIFGSATGSGFVYSGYSNNVDSFLMAVGFAAALTAYYEGLVRLRADRTVESLSVPRTAAG
jgi:heme A synthase